MSYMALYRKFRPTEFGDVRGQDHIVTTLKNNPDLSLISLLDKSLLNPVANKFKLLNNITELSTIGQDSREIWFSGQCLMVSSEIVTIIKKQLKD